jgi:pimeloyl-ACP methyl ester carboxylesterase
MTTPTRIRPPADAVQPQPQAPERRSLLLLAAGCLSAVTVGARAAESAFPGRRSRYLGWARHDFTTDGQSFTVAAPQQAAPGRPWLWVAEFFGNDFWHGLDARLLERGWHIAHNASAAGLYGCPRAVAAWSAAYEVWTRRFTLAAKPVLAGYSRGGLLAYNWAASRADAVGAIYADAPVCTIGSWPGGKGRGKGSARDWQTCLAAYGITDEQASAYASNPVDRLGPLARAQVPLLHVVGDADDVVPVEENTALIEARYLALGRAITVIHKPGIGHHPHALADPTPIVEFITRSGSAR